MHGIILTGRLLKSIFWCVQNGRFKTFPAYNKEGGYSSHVKRYMSQNGLTEAEFTHSRFIGTPIAYYMRLDVVRMLKIDAPQLVQNEPEQDSYISAILAE